MTKVQQTIANFVFAFTLLFLGYQIDALKNRPNPQLVQKLKVQEELNTRLLKSIEKQSTLNNQFITSIENQSTINDKQITINNGFQKFNAEVNNNIDKIIQINEILLNRKR